jgi:hypothetical protein
MDQKPFQFGLASLLWATAWIALAVALLMSPNRTYLLLVLGGLAGGAVYVVCLGLLGIGDGWRGVLRLFRRQ